MYDTIYLWYVLLTYLPSTHRHSYTTLVWIAHTFAAMDMWISPTFQTAHRTGFVRKGNSIRWPTWKWYSPTPFPGTHVQVAYEFFGGAAIISHVCLAPLESLSRNSDQFRPHTSDTLLLDTCSSQKPLPTAQSPQASPISGTTSGFQEFLHLLHWPLILEVRISFCCFMRIKAIILFHWNVWKDCHLHLLVCTDVYTCVCVQETQTGGVYAGACQWRSRNSRWWIIFPRVVEIQLENVNTTTSSCPVAFLCFIEGHETKLQPAPVLQPFKKKTAIHHPSPDFRWWRLYQTAMSGPARCLKNWRQTHLDPIQKANGTSSYVLDAASYFFWYGAWLGKWAKNGPNCWLSGDFLCLGRLGKGERSPSWSSAKQWCTDHSCAALGSGIQDNSTAPITRLCVHMWIYVYKLRIIHL